MKTLMNNKLLYVLIMLLSFLVQPAQAKIDHTFSITSNTTKKLGEWVDKDTIVFIELDDTLMMPKSLMFSFDRNPYRMFIDNLVSVGEKSPMFYQAVAVWYGQRKVKLVEDGWPDLIKQMQAKGAKVYGICKMPINLTNIENKRLQELKELGVTFTTSINELEDIMVQKEQPWFSRFYKGVLFTGPYSKMHAIMELFRVTNNIPKKLLVFLNMNYEVKEVDTALRVFNMEYYIVEYLASRQILGRPNKEVVKFQQEQLIEAGMWLEDDAAENLLKQSKQQQNKNAAEVPK